MGGFNIRDIVDPTGRFRGNHGNGGGRSSSGQSGDRPNRRTMAFGGGGRISFFAQLPPEVLAHIFAFLPARDIANVARVCKAFHEASLIDRVWQARCKADYKVILPTLHHPLSYKQLYTKVLHKYGHLHGLWQADITNYGGLVQVKFEDDRLVGIEWRTPVDPNFMDPLRRRDLFSVDLAEDGQARVQCLRGYNGPHQCQIVPISDNTFNSKCCLPDNHRHPDGNAEEFREWVKEETCNANRYSQPLSLHLLQLKFLDLKRYENSYDFRRLPLPSPVAKAAIQPGIFKGTYGDHGLEFILLNYDAEGINVIATKLLGDPNVPVGSITFRGDLRYSMVLSLEEQSNLQTLSRIRRVASELSFNKPASLQPFCVPEGCMERGTRTPNQCKARFHAFGRVAGHGYTNPSYTAGHWVIFDDDLFGFLWLDLCSLSMYHRVQEDLC